MYIALKIKKGYIYALIICLVTASLIPLVNQGEANVASDLAFMKWVKFDIPPSLMKEAIALDIDSYYKQEAARISWIEVLAYLGSEYDGDFSEYQQDDLTILIQALQSGNDIQGLCGDPRYYEYYLQAYSVVFGGFVGEYEMETEKNGERIWESGYGLKVFSPIAKGYGFTESDDFIHTQSGGCKRVHLGHDMMTPVDTPVTAVESGIVEVMGWNLYSGWRIAIRSFDGKRSYYFANLRKNRPYADGLELGQVVMAGDVIGYVGHGDLNVQAGTGGMKESHLHWGLQLIGHGYRKEGEEQIWIDLYDITRFLNENQSRTQGNDDTKEHGRVYGFRERIPDSRFELSQSVPPFEPEMDCKIEQTVAALDVVVPVLMYHDILKDPARQQTYVITPSKFEQDLIFIKENGYETVVIQDIVDYVEKGKVLPEKPILITFDDGHFNNVFYAEPLLKKYEMQAVIFVVGAFCEKAVKEGEENPNYSYLTWDRIALMAKEGVWDIQSHSWDMHNMRGARRGILQKKGETDIQYKAALREDFTKISQKLYETTGKYPIAFAYPFGYIDDRVEDVLRELGYKVTLCSASGKARLVSGLPDSLFCLRRLARTNNKSARSLLKV